MTEEQLMAIIGAGSGLIGTILGAGLSWYTTDRLARVQNTLDLHREWQSPEVTRARMMADKLIHAMRDKDLLRIELESDPAQSNGIWVVLNFFQRLSVLVRHKRVARTLVPDLFGTYIVWWHLNCFADRLPDAWAIRQDWESLYGWLLRNAPPADLAIWQRNAEFAKANRSSPEGAGQ